MKLVIDRPAVVTGALTTAFFAVPLALGANWAAGRGEDGIALWCNIGVLVAFVVGSGCSAWIQNTGYPIAHAVITAIATFVVLTGVGILVSVLRGRSPHWFQQVFLLTLTMAAGLLGGLLGARLKASGVEPQGSRSDRGD